MRVNGIISVSQFQIPVLKGRVVWRRPWVGAVRVELALHPASLGSSDAATVCVSPSGAECPQATLSTFHAQIRAQASRPPGAALSTPEVGDGSISLNKKKSMRAGGEGGLLTAAPARGLDQRGCGASRAGPADGTQGQQRADAALAAPDPRSDAKMQVSPEQEEGHFPGSIVRLLR
ncbi:hypothetical protein R6Z07F_010002 [Ovis aries]